MVCKDKLFDRWCGFKKNNRMVSPVELLIHGTLHYLGHGWTFNNCEESTAIDQEVQHSFYRVFILFGSTVLYKQCVLTPINLTEAKSKMHEYSKAGFPGCIGLLNCTHIITDCCEYNPKNNHLGAKSSLTMRTFNLTCNHCHRILHSTKGGPGRWNDQTMNWLDTLVSGFVTVVSWRMLPLKYLFVTRRVV
jgi:hypothetical protein